MQSPDEVKSQVEKLIGDDPTITDPTKIIARVEKAGPLFKKRMTITLEGKAANQHEKEKIEQTLNSHFRDSVAIENKIAVD